MFGLVEKAQNEEVAAPALPIVAPEDFHRAVYVASSSSEIERAERVMEKLRGAGMIVTSSWAANIRKVGAANPMDAPREQQAVWASTCLHEVSIASITLLLFPTTPTIGAWHEVGYALALKAMTDMGIEAGALPPYAARTIIGAGSTPPKSIFKSLYEVFEDDDKAIDAILAAVFHGETPAA